MISKNRSKKTLYSLDRRIGVYLLVAGIVLFATALTLQLVFLRGTNFKQDYRKLQNQDCIQKGNSESLCNSKYPL